MTFWQHMLRGWLILMVPFAICFLISLFTPWDMFDQTIVSDDWLYIPPVFGAFWIALFFWRKREKPAA
jgi:hypothetical protein